MAKRKIAPPKLTEIWFIIVLVIIVALLFEQAFSLESTASWIRLIVFFLLLILSFFVAKAILHKRKINVLIRTVVVDERWLGKHDLLIAMSFKKLN